MNIISVQELVNQGVEVSDGFHTFTELYEHRVVLFIALCKSYSKDIWRSKFHSDGSVFDGWFVLGIGKMEGSQITYHLPLSKWEDTNFAETLEKAPEWDSHTASDVLIRLGLL